MTIVRLDNLLKKSSGSTLGRVVHRARDMERLTTALRAALPMEMAQNLLAANLREDGELVLICASSAWAARVRFESEHLLKAARKAGLTVNNCKVCVSQGR